VHKNAIQGEKMPIYEYISLNPEEACMSCVLGFEALHASAKMLSCCPECGARVRRLVSWCGGQVRGANEAFSQLETRVRDYEKRNMWSHAAELAEKGAGQHKNEALRSRAFDNYAKAGYALKTLDKQVNKSTAVIGTE
jgi:predicted nucleic acid-binding Zn ribbon protein